VVEISINNFRETLLIGGAWDADLNRDEIVPYTSPLAKCLLKKHAGEKATLPTNKATVEILKVETPSLTFIQKAYSLKIKRAPEEPNLFP
jgi:transcription elongation GreA/GreB family factor